MVILFQLKKVKREEKVTFDQSLHCRGGLKCLETRQNKKGEKNVSGKICEKK
jgi:hypothetical protein